MHDLLSVGNFFFCTVWQRFVYQLTETLLVLFLMMLLISVFESVYQAKSNQSIQGRVRNLAITSLNMAISLFTISAISVLSPIKLHHVVFDSIQAVFMVLFFLVIYDYFFYWYHRAQHQFSFLWAVHELHHSDAELNSSSSARSFWLEGVLQRTFIAIPTICLAPLDLKSALIAALIAKLWLVFTHANLRLNLGYLTPLVCGPQLHRIHHSIDSKHCNKNFAQFFPFWDVLFSTYYQPKSDEFPDTGTPSLQSDISPLASIIRPVKLWYLQFKQLFDQQNNVIKSFFLSDHSDNTWTLSRTWPAKLAALGLIIGMAFSAPLWTDIGRTLPISPLTTNSWAQLLTPFLTIATILSAFAVILSRSIRLSCFALIASLATLILLDLNRLQPWVYEYCLIFVLTLFKDRSKAADPQGRLKYLALLLIGIYFFSGIEKINWHFLTETGPWLSGFQASPRCGLGSAPIPVIVSAIMCTGEVLISILLVFKTTRMIGLGCALIMHSSILAMLGPHNHNVNAVVWPWNVVQMMLLSGCFLQLEVSGKSLMYLDFKNDFKSATVISIAGLLLPLLGLLQIVDPYLAFALYSGDVPHGTLYFDSATHAKLTRRIQRTCSYDRSCNLWQIDIADWSLVETTAPSYPSVFCLKSMANRFDSTYKPDRLLLRISRFPKLSSAVINEDSVLSDSTNYAQPIYSEAP